MDPYLKNPHLTPEKVRQLTAGNRPKEVDDSPQAKLRQQRARNAARQKAYRDKKQQTKT